MASAEQMIQLLKSHADGDHDQFYTISLQVAANESRKGHHHAARKIKAIINQTKASKTNNKLIAMFPANNELSSLLTVTQPSVPLSSLTYSSSQQQVFQRIIEEVHQQSRLREYGLEPRRKLLCCGKPGTGKTVSAAALATELGLPLFTVRLDGLVNKLMGETASKLRQIFEATYTNRGVYFFDEFDAIGAHRTSANDVGEIRRVLNSFLQFLEENDSNSLIIAATNHKQLLDEALFRRFDDVICYELPDAGQCRAVMANRLCRFDLAAMDWHKIIASANTLSHAEISKACDDAAKTVILNDQLDLTTTLLVEMLERRQRFSHQKQAQDAFLAAGRQS